MPYGKERKYISWNLCIKTTLGTNKMWSYYTQVFFICRFNNIESVPLGTCKMWSLYAGDLFIEVLFRAAFTVYE